jgi:hypothetical protein
MMCRVVKASNLLALALSINNSVSCGTLIKIRNSIESKNPDIVVDVSKNSISSAQKRYPYLFKIVSENIERSKNFLKLPEKYLNDEFYESMGPDLLTRVKKEVESALVRLERT